MHFSKISFLLVIAFLLNLNVNAQEWHSFQSQRKINDLLDTGTELILATDAGLVVVNKSTLEKTIYNAENSNLGKNHIQTIASAPNGDTWIGTYDVKLYRFDGTEFFDMITPDNANYNEGSTKIYNLEIAPNGDFWMGTTDGVFQKSGTNWSHFDEDEIGMGFFEPWDIAINNQGEVFVASIDLFKFSNGVWDQISDSDSIQNYLHAKLHFAANGDLYMAGDLTKIGRLSGNVWEQLDYSSIGNGSEVKGIAEDTSGNIYIQTLYDGIFKLVNDTWTLQSNIQTTQFDNLSDYLYIDNEDNSWLNSNIRLSVLRNGILENMLISNYTLPTNNIITLSKGMNGSIYFGNDLTDNISYVDTAGDWGSISAPNTWATFENSSDILYLNDNNIWIATNFGLHHFDGSWSFFNEGFTRTFAVNSQGEIYVSKDQAIIKIADNVMTEINTSNSSLNPNATFIAGIGVDSDDNLWIASGGDNMIQKLATDGTWTNFTDADYPAIVAPEGDFHFDINGNMWIPVSGAGVLKYDGNEFSNPYTGNLSLMDNYNVFSVESDNEGKMYFAHQYGITTFDNGTFEDLLIDENEVPHENTSATSEIRFDDDGVLWWASNRNGVFAYGEKTVSSLFSPEQSSFDMKLFPNPATNQIQLEFDAATETNGLVRIYNTLGQLEREQRLDQLGIGLNTMLIDISNLKAGHYMIQLKTENQTVSKAVLIF